MTTLPPRAARPALPRRPGRLAAPVAQPARRRRRAGRRNRRRPRRSRWCSGPTRPGCSRRRGAMATRPSRPSARRPRSSRCCAPGARASRTSWSWTTRRLPEDVERGLWDGVARGLLTSDGFGAVRSRVDRLAPGRLAPLLPAAARRPERDRGSGRWSLVSDARRRPRPRRARGGGRRAVAAPLGRHLPRPRSPRLAAVPVARAAVGAPPARGPRPRAGRAVRQRVQRRAVRAAGGGRAARCTWPSCPAPASA